MASDLHDEKCRKNPKVQDGFRVNQPSLRKTCLCGTPALLTNIVFYIGWRVLVNQRSVNTHIYKPASTSDGIKAGAERN